MSKNVKPATGMQRCWAHLWLYSTQSLHLCMYIVNQTQVSASDFTSFWYGCNMCFKQHWLLWWGCCKHHLSIHMHACIHVCTYVCMCVRYQNAPRVEFNQSNSIICIVSSYPTNQNSSTCFNIVRMYTANLLCVECLDPRQYLFLVLHLQCKPDTFKTIVTQLLVFAKLKILSQRKKFQS